MTDDDEQFYLCPARLTHRVPRLRIHHQSWRVGPWNAPVNIADPPLTLAGSFWGKPVKIGRGPLGNHKKVR